MGGNEDWECLAGVYLWVIVAYFNHPDEPPEGDERNEWTAFCFVECDAATARAGTESLERSVWSQHFFAKFFMWPWAWMDPHKRARAIESLGRASFLESVFKTDFMVSLPWKGWRKHAQQLWGENVRFSITLMDGPAYRNPHDDLLLADSPETPEAPEGTPGKPRNQGKTDQCRGAYTAAITEGRTPPTPTELAAMVGCDKATASRAVKDLEGQRKAFAKEDAASRYRDHVDDEDVA